MKTYTTKQLKMILEEHTKWLNDPKTGKRADLFRANLFKADLSNANLSEANLTYANLYGANLSYANFYEADLYKANLSEAYLSKADLYKANLSCANLCKADLFNANLCDAIFSEANLSGTDLTNANLYGANLSYANFYEADLLGANLSESYLYCANLSKANLLGANLSNAYLTKADLSNAILPDFLIVPEEGEFIGYKKLQEGYVCTLLIPKNAKRISSLVGRKCRASEVKVIAIEDKNGKAMDKSFVKVSCTHYPTTYRIGKVVKPDKFDDDIRVECTNGIHFFITKKEAKEYGV